MTETHARWYYGHFWARAYSWPPAWDPTLVNSGRDPTSLLLSASRLASGMCCGGFINAVWGTYGDGMWYWWQPFWYRGKASELADHRYVDICGSSLIDDPLTFALPPLYIYGRVIQNSPLDWVFIGRPRIRLSMPVENGPLPAG